MSLALAGCGGPPPLVGAYTDRPEWTASAPASSEAFSAVGQVGFTSAADLRIATADARARAAVAAEVTRRLGDALDAASLDDETRDAARAVVEALGLGGVEIERRYYARDRNVQFSLARLSAAALDAQLAALDELPPAVRDALRAAGRDAMKR